MILPTLVKKSGKYYELLTQNWYTFETEEQKIQTHRVWKLQ